jgi:photoactive yellow protein
MADAIDFDAPDIARRIEALSQHELDQLPFGVILLDRHFVVRFYSATEARESGYGMEPLGRDFFEVSRCDDKLDLRARWLQAMERGPVDFDLSRTGDLANPKRELRMRIVTARNGGLWLFVDRDRR